MQRNPNLPEEILIEIFSRIPAKAVGRCRCLSKTWRTHLSTYQFVNLHLRRTTSPENLLLINAVDHSILHIVDGPIVDNTVSRKLELGVSWEAVLGCCNGLVLLSSTERELFLVNPNTMQHFKLPPFSLGSYKFRFVIDDHGLGYDSSSDDYKVVVFTYGSGPGHNLYDRLIYVYSVKYGTWKRVDASLGCHGFGIMRGAFCNGAIHGYSYISSVRVIKAFDLADNVLREIPFPTDKYDARPTYQSIQVLEGCLWALKFLSSGDAEIWVMKQYGMADSWTKFTTVRQGELYARSYLCLTGDREKIVLVTCKKDVVVYNVEDGTTKDMVVDGVPAKFPDDLVVCDVEDGAKKDMVVDGVPAKFCDGVPFIDSLVSPNHQYSN